MVAPIAGLTDIRQIDEGNIVHVTDTTGLVTITQIKPIAVLFSLPQQDLPELNKVMSQGQLGVQALAADNTTLLDRGHVVVINNQVDQTTGTVQLKAEFPNPQVQLWPGQFANIRVLIDTLRRAVVVPTAAVQLGPDGSLRLRGRPERHRQGQAGHGTPGGRSPGGDRKRCHGVGNGGHQRLRTARRRHQGGGSERRGRRARHRRAGTAAAPRGGAPKGNGQRAQAPAAAPATTAIP